MPFIYMWYVRKADPHPMYGHDKILGRFINKADALIYARKLVDKGKDEIFVEERRYTDEFNLKRDFCFDSRVVWSRWFDCEKEG